MLAGKADARSRATRNMMSILREGPGDGLHKQLQYWAIVKVHWD